MDPFEDRRPSMTIHVLSEKPCTSLALSLSRIEGMTVGDVRQCFSQMRNTPGLSANTTLWCGMTAGVFALKYLVNTGTGARLKKKAFVRHS